MTKDDLSDLFYSGTSGLVLPFNKTQYPAEFKDKSRLHYYAALFNSLEINSVFYKLPKHTTVNNWAASVPENFRFTFKVPKVITHAPYLDFALTDVIDFMEVVKNIGDRKGCLLVQFPPSLSIEKIDSLKRLLAIFNQDVKLAPWKLAIEFRNSSWYEPQVYDLLQSCNASMVLHDMKNSATPWNIVHSDFIYLRFHGTEPRYRGDYSVEFLKQLADSIKKWISEGKTVYAYFNNTLGAAFSNLQTLNQFVQA